MRVICWNPEALPALDLIEVIPRSTHPAVRPTTYEEVHRLIGTSGCSAQSPYWSWSVMGVYATENGVQLVRPGDYVVEFDEKVIMICTPEQWEILGKSGLLW